MNANFKAIVADKIVLGSLLLGIFISLLHFIFLLFSLSSLPPFVPLFNQMPWGEARLATKTEAFIPLLLGVSILVGNNIGASLLYQQMPLIARFLSVTGLLAVLLAFMVVIRTVLIVI